MAKLTESVIKDLMRDVAGAGTTAVLSDIEDQWVSIVRYGFTKSEDGERDLVEFTTSEGQRIRAGGMLVLQAFTEITESLKEKAVSLEHLEEAGYQFQGKFSLKHSTQNAKKTYWTVQFRISGPSEE